MARQGIKPGTILILEGCATPALWKNHQLQQFPFVFSNADRVDEYISCTPPLLTLRYQLRLRPAQLDGIASEVRARSPPNGPTSPCPSTNHSYTLHPISVAWTRQSTRRMSMTCRCELVGPGPGDCHSTPGA
jgi:hypothetical protein